MSAIEASSLTTAFLLDKVRSGDQQAKAQLVARIDPLLQRFARGRVPQLLRHQHDTSDLIQSTWMRVLERLPEIRVEEKGAFFAYLRVALSNALKETIRRHQRSPFAPGVDPHDSDTPAASVDLADWLSWEQALAAMDPPLRGLVLMRFEFGMSFQEIAMELGETPDGVRMKLSRALAKMASSGLEL